MEKILIDTDVLIDFLRGYQKKIRDIFIKIEDKDIQPYTTILNIVELYSGTDVTNKNKLVVLEQLLSYFNIITIELQTAKLAGRLRLKYNLSLADAVIAACAVEAKIKLLTLNIKDFQKIKELTIV